jgi:hypothetical protein
MAQSTITKRARANARVRDYKAAVNPSEDVERQIASMAVLDISGLRWAWREKTGHNAPEGITRDLLIRALAYRLQVRAHGDIDRRLKQVLESVANGDLSAIAADRTVGNNLRPGTTLLREYRGDTHRVIVQEGGYAWNGEVFTTLSAVAKSITGSNWNGYVFFGLKGKTKASND